MLKFEFVINMTTAKALGLSVHARPDCAQSALSNREAVLDDLRLSPGFATPRADAELVAGQRLVARIRSAFPDDAAFVDDRLHADGLVNSNFNFNSSTACPQRRLVRSSGRGAASPACATER